MKVLFVCSGNSQAESPFVKEQANSLKRKNVDVDFFFIKGRGYWGYLKNFLPLRRKIRIGGYDLVHAHYGLSGAIALLASNVSVIITFHGDDINIFRNRLISIIASNFASQSIFVSQKLQQKAGISCKGRVIPCGVDLDTFFPVEKEVARKKMGLHFEKKYILFAGSFSEPVKNVELAREAVQVDNDFQLIELGGYTRTEVNLLMNASDVLMMTSFSEGSPQVIKEAMACNCPIVSTDVGDVREVVEDTEGCYITTFDAGNVANNLTQAFEFGRNTNGRESVGNLELSRIADKVISVYTSILEQN